MKIGICAPAAAFTREDADRVIALAAQTHPDGELVFHDQCFLEAGHFAGTDQQRLKAFVALANDPGIDAIWFARGGYGACRIAEDAVKQLNAVQRAERPISAIATRAICLGLCIRPGLAGQCMARWSLT